MKTRLYILAAVVSAMFAVLIASCNRDNTTPVLTYEEVVDTLSNYYRPMLKNVYLSKAEKYKASKKLMFFVDFKTLSHHDRFFVWDAEQDKIVYACWCAHGMGGESTDSVPQFSNVVGSNCSSLGWYLVDRAKGKSPTYGYSYHAVDGLDKTNSNARRRQILIHHWYSVTVDSHVKIKRPMRADYRSAGCFTLADEAFVKIDSFVKATPERILLYAFNGKTN